MPLFTSPSNTADAAHQKSDQQHTHCRPTHAHDNVEICITQARDDSRNRRVRNSVRCYHGSSGCGDGGVFIVGGQRRYDIRVSSACHPRVFNTHIPNFDLRNVSKTFPLTCGCRTSSGWRSPYRGKKYSLARLLRGNL